MIYLYVIIPIIILLILLFTSRQRVKDDFEKLSKKSNSQGLTGKDVANIVARKHSLNISISVKDQDLCDAYYPGKKVLLLSQKVCNTPSIASVAIVCHELGHAIQHKNNTFLYRINEWFRKVTNITNKFIIPLLIGGLLCYAFKWPTDNLGLYLVISSGALFVMQALVKILIIPLEFDASKRAMNLIEESNLLTKKEVRQGRRLLKTAGQTYIVALFDGISAFTKKFFRLFK